MQEKGKKVATDKYEGRTLSRGSCQKKASENRFGARAACSPFLNLYSRHINPFLVCFPSRARDSGVQKWFQNFDLNFFFIKVNSKIDFC
jgi:hypothetical protein